SPRSAPSPSAPTVTAGTPGVVAAALGGPQDAFLAKYGSPNDYYGGLYDVNNVTFKLSLDAGSDGQQRVYQMLAYPSNTVVWLMQRARSICTDFLPPDAARTTQGADDEGNILYHYTSIQLAGSFSSTSPRYDPTGAATITYITHDGGVLQC